MRRIDKVSNYSDVQGHNGPGFYVILETRHSTELTIHESDNFDNLDDLDFDDEHDESEPSLYIDSEFIPGTDISKATAAFLQSLTTSAGGMIRWIDDMASYSDVHLNYYLVPFKWELTSEEMDVEQDLLRTNGAYFLLEGSETLMFRRRK